MKDKIYYFQEKSNDILDLQDELTIEEIGMFFILKAAYFKNFGELTENNLVQRCRFFGDKEKLIQLARKLFEFKEGCLINNSWLSQIKGIKEKSNKRKEAANIRWQKEQEESKTEAKQKQEESKTEGNVNVNVECKSKSESKLKIINENYTILADGLIFVLEAKMNKKLPSGSQKSYAEEIRKLIEIDLKVRAEAEEDVKKAIQAISDNYGKDYFPIVQSGGSFREKFIKIEDYLKRTQNNKKTELSDTYQLCQTINNLAGNNLLLKIEKNGGAAVLYFKSENDFEGLKKLTPELREEIKKTIADKLGTSKLEFKF